MHAALRPVAILACTAAITGCRPLSSHPVAVTAVEELRDNARVTEVLGQPVTCDSRVRGTAHEGNGIAALTFGVKGPKGSGTAVVEGKKTQGTWGVTLLQLRPAGGEPLTLTADIETDTPKFDSSAAPAKTTTPAAPPSDVEIALPPGASGG